LSIACDSYTLYITRWNYHSKYFIIINIYYHGHRVLSCPLFTFKKQLGYFFTACNNKFNSKRVHQYQYSLPSSAQVKNMWSYTSTHLVAWCLIKHRIHLHGVILSSVQGQLYLLLLSLFQVHITKEIKDTVAWAQVTYRQ
jgi:hypothetical protein